MCALRDIRELDLKRSSWDSSGRARERAREREKSAALEALDGEPVKRSTKSAAKSTFFGCVLRLGPTIVLEQCSHEFLSAISPPYACRVAHSTTWRPCLLGAD